MIIVAGAPGSGKSTLFPVSTFGVDFFNADDVAAQLNNGSYHDIPGHIRKTVNQKFEQWIAEHIAAKRSFAIETTFRTPISLEQAAHAVEQGFKVDLIYVALERFEMNLERVMKRADAGGHSAPIETLEGIYRGTQQTFRKALTLCGSVLSSITVYDNSVAGTAARRVYRLSMADGSLQVRVFGSIPQFLLRDLMDLLSS
jgi:predicted ABC-type ATPase